VPCTTEPETFNPHPRNDPTLLTRHANQDDNKENAAFFIETTGNGTLNYRQACAVESLALHNSNLKIHVLFTDAKINESLVTLQTLVKNYANVQFVRLNVDEYMAGTLMDHWYHCTDWRSGSYHVNNLSNALRLLTVYKYGGYYFDLDIISVRPVTYYRNFVAAESDKHVNNDVIHADLKNAFIETAIKDFVFNFRQDRS
jgi:lactosylceramide 4-alpha-galactosyltransferase